MPKYRFNFVARRDAALDRGGAELDSLLAAHRHARAIIGAALAAISDDQLREWRIEVTDDSGRPVLTVPFFPIVAQRQASERRQGAGRGRDGSRPARVGGPSGGDRI